MIKIAQLSLTDSPVIRGATWRLKVKYLRPDGETPVDLEGATARMRVRLASQPDLEWPGVIDTETGEILVELTPEETAELYFSAAEVIFEVVFASEVRVLFTGNLNTQ